MAKVLIICPTITGREGDLERCFGSYVETLSGVPFVFVSPKDEPSWGVGINAGMLQAESEGLDAFTHVHLTSDDIEAHDGWFGAADNALKRGAYPAPMLLNPDGSVAGFGHGDANMYDTSKDWKPTKTSVVPTMTMGMWKRMGPMIPLMYFTDDFMSHQARHIGFPSIAVKDYRFTHHHSEVLPTVDGMSTRQERLYHDLELYNRYLATGEWPGGQK